MRNKLLVAGTLALAMTCTTVFSSITPAVVKAASVSTVQTQTAENSDDYVYCYAGLTWAEYWKAEGVMAAGDTTSSDTAAEVSNTLFATTFVEPTIPTFWLYVAVGSPPNRAPRILVIP